MESVRFARITFRSKPDKEWFQQTLWIFMFSVCWYVGVITFSHLPALAASFPAAIKMEDIFLAPIFDFKKLSWVSLSVAYFGMSLITVFVAIRNLLYNRAVNGEKFSLDCIWFNALVAAIYLDLVIIF